MSAAFSPVQASNQPIGPGSNTGQKSTLTAPIIDFCVVVIDSEKAKKLTRKMPLGDLVRYVFGTGSAIVVGPIQDRIFNFYPRSATMVDETGSVCGKIGLDDDGKVCISLSGQGCQHVRSWPQVANVHRHRGLDFIFVSQSPAKQVDEFVHDLIERHIHVRRRFGLPFAHLRIFDRFERNPEKASPLILKRVKLPKRPMGLYESTVMDTVEKKIPWYYIALAIGLPATAFGAWHQFGAVEDSLAGKSSPAAMVATKDGAANGAPATVAATDIPPPAAPSRESDYVAWLTPRIPGHQHISNLIFGQLAKRGVSVGNSDKHKIHEALEGLHRPSHDVPEPDFRPHFVNDRAN